MRWVIVTNTLREPVRPFVACVNVEVLVPHTSVNHPAGTLPAAVSMDGFAIKLVAATAEGTTHSPTAIIAVTKAVMTTLVFMVRRNATGAPCG
ncbi:MAG: hypothetical protein U0Q19_14465 [Kineosporiaceae bacterium]